MRERGTRPGAVRWALALVGVLVAASCGTTPDPLETLTSAPDRAEDRSSFRMHVEVRGAVEGEEDVPDSLTVMDGAVDLPTRRGGLTISSGFAEETAAGEQATCEIRFAGSARYYELGGEGGTSWLRIDEEVEASVDDPTSWVGGSGAFLEHLRGVSEDVEVLGEEEVRGVPTTHYGFTVSAEQIRETEGVEPRFLEAFGVETLPTEAWVDADGLPRRLFFTVERTIEGTGLRLDVLIELYDFGEPVAVDVPPSGDVVHTEDHTRAALACFGGPGVPEGAPGGGSPELRAQSTLLAIVSSAKDIAAEHGSYEAVTTDRLRAAVRDFGGDRVGLEVVGEGPSTGPGEISVLVVGPEEIRMALLGEGDRCIGVRSLLRPEVGSLGAFFASRQVGDDGTCRADLFSDDEYTLSLEEIASGS